MKSIKLLGIGLVTLLLSFLIVFLGLEIYKHTVAQDLFRARNPYDLVIKNARIIDGTGQEVYRGDIGIRNNVIMNVGKKLETEGAIIFDASGYTVAPDKVEWPKTLDWLERDLASSLLRYPYHRIIVKEASNPHWIGKSVKALLANEQTTIAQLAKDNRGMALIAPKLDEPEADNLFTAFYRITGWRSELLGKKTGKIKEGFQAKLVVFNHRLLKDDQIIKYLIQEKLPPIDYIIKGSEIQSIKTNS
jgi:hypothetical protein